MNIVRQKLEAALQAHEGAVPVLIEEALAALGTMEADARRWRAFRWAAVHQDERFVNAMAAHPIADDEHPADSEIDAAADAGIAAML